MYSKPPVSGPRLDLARTRRRGASGSAGFTVASTMRATAPKAIEPATRSKRLAATRAFAQVRNAKDRAIEFCGKIHDRLKPPPGLGVLWLSPVTAATTGSSTISFSAGNARQAASNLGISVAGSNGLADLAQLRRHEMETLGIAAGRQKPRHQRIAKAILARPDQAVALFNVQHHPATCRQR